jgi:hypothetical protein
MMSFTTFVWTDTPARLALAEAAIEAALRLHPDAGEAHLARAGHLYWGYLDYAEALRELEIARQTLPNDARLFELKGYIERRRPDGTQEEALRNLERAIDLDPRNFLVLQQTALSYYFLAATPTKQPSWTACWLSDRPTLRRKSRGRSSSCTGKQIPALCTN